MVKAQVLPNRERRSKEAERESRSSECIDFAEGQKHGQTFTNLIYTDYWKNVTQKKWNFPLSGEESLGRGLMPNVFPVLDARFWQVPVHKWSTDLCSCSKGEDLCSAGIESSMALIIWMNTLHFWWWKACKGLHKWSFDQRENTRGRDSAQDWKETECWPKAEKLKKPYMHNINTFLGEKWTEQKGQRVTGLRPSHSRYTSRDG